MITTYGWEEREERVVWELTARQTDVWIVRYRDPKVAVNSDEGGVHGRWVRA